MHEKSPKYSGKVYDDSKVKVSVLKSSMQTPFVTIYKKFVRAGFCMRKKIFDFDLS